MSTSDSGRISVYCPCGAKVKVAEEHLGRKAKCPKCAEVFTLEVTQDRDDGTLKVSPPDTETDLLSEIAAAAKKEQTATTLAPKNGVTCVHCNQKHPADARICVHCGYDSTKGRVVKAPANVKESDGFLVSIARRLGAFGFGCALSTGGALIGAVVWFAVAVISEFEIGYIAIGLGMLAGGGMAMGYRERNARAGATAALISLGGIVAAKLAIFIYINAADISTLRADIAQIGSEAQLIADSNGYEVAQHRADREALRNQWSQDSPRRDIAYETHSEAVAELTEEELAGEILKLKAWNAAGKWEDEDYPTDFLIMHYAVETWEAKLKENGTDLDEDYPSPGKREWRRLVDAARTKVEAIDPQEVTALAKKVDSRNKLEIHSMELVYEVVAIQVVREGISPNDEDRYNELVEAATEANESLTTEEITAALAERETWTKTGRWEDPEYLRKNLIYEKTLELVQDEAIRRIEQNDYDWEVTNLQWASFQADATAETEPLSDGEVVAMTKQLEADAQARQQAFFDRIQKQVTTETAKEAMSYFFADYFGGMDLLFGFFAIAAAWGIASGAQEE